MKNLLSTLLILASFIFNESLFAQCKAAFTESVNNATKTVTFTNTSIKSNKFQWQFGDGTYSTVKNPVHTYSKSGRYNAILVSQDTINNCVDSTGIWVDVGCVSEGSIIWSQGKKLHYFTNNLEFTNLDLILAMETLHQPILEITPMLIMALTMFV